MIISYIWFRFGLSYLSGSGLIISYIWFRFGLSYLSGLNTEYPPECVSPPADQAAQDIRKVVLKLFADFLSPDGKYVDYKVTIC